MGWKTSKPHESKKETEKIGPKHVDVYHTNDAGKRDKPHHEDIKISYPEDGKIIRDIEPPKKTYSGG